MATAQTAKKRKNGSEESHPECRTKTAAHPGKLKEELGNRLRRIEGQIRGIARMIEEDVYCDDVLHQILSVESALAGVKTSLLEAHLKGCVVDQIQNGESDVIEELLVTMRKMMK